MKAVEIQNLSYTYPDGTPALNNISLAIAAGETIGLIGPNGSGKSTLLLHLNGILNGKAQTAKIFGMELAPINFKEIRKIVGLVFQDPEDQLFMPTVHEDVAFAPLNYGLPKAEVIRRVANALIKVEMTGSKNRSSHHLSFGEKKRVAIATVLAQQPSLLALDEPTSNTDPKIRRHLIDFLKTPPITQIIASHDLPMIAELCRRVFILYKGTIVHQGPAKEILENRLILEKFGLA